MGWDSYKTFGLRRHWLEDFLLRGKEFFQNNTLGPQQIKAFKRYLKHSELISSKGELTPLYFRVREIFEKKGDTAWLVVWFYLCKNSELFKWYVETFPWNFEFTKNLLEEKLKEQFHLSERTAKNSINALINTFKTSPLGNWFGIPLGRDKFLKKGTPTVDGEVIKLILEREDIETSKGFELFHTVFGIDGEGYIAAVV